MKIWTSIVALLGLATQVLAQPSSPPLSIGQLSSVFKQDSQITLLEGIARSSQKLTKTLHEANNGTPQPQYQQEAVLFDSDGPGIVNQIWFVTNDPTAPTWKLRVYTDGKLLPDVDAEVGSIYGGSNYSTGAVTNFWTPHVGYFNKSTTVIQGAWSFSHVVPFKTNCRVTLYNPNSGSVTQQSIWSVVTYTLGKTSNYRLKSSTLAPYYGTTWDGSNSTGTGSNLTFASSTAGKGIIAQIGYVGWSSTGPTFQERDFAFYTTYAGLVPIYHGTGTEDFFRGAFYAYPSLLFCYSTPTTLSNGIVAVKDILTECGGYQYTNGFKLVLPSETAVVDASWHTGCTLYYEDITTKTQGASDTTAIATSSLPSGLEFYWDFNLDHWRSVFELNTSPRFMRSTSGRQVGYVSDLSGNGHNLLQATAANRPSLATVAQGGLTGLTHVQANNQYLMTSAASQIKLNDFDIMFVGSFSTNTQRLLSNNNLQGTANQSTLWVNGSKFASFDGVNSATSTANYTDIVTTQSVAVYEFVRSGNICSWYVNGTKLGNDVTAAAAQQIVLDVICRWSNVEQPVMDQRAWLGWNRPLTSGERSSAVATIRSKYGI